MTQPPCYPKLAGRNYQFLENCKRGFFDLFFAFAAAKIEVLATMRAKPFAIFSAKLPHRNCQKDLFSYHFVHFNGFSVKENHIQIFSREPNLFLEPGNAGQRFQEDVDLFLDRKGIFFQAAIAGENQFGLHFSSNLYRNPPSLKMDFGLNGPSDRIAISDQFSLVIFKGQIQPLGGNVFEFDLQSVLIHRA
jgi:hypothetical protein